MAATPGTSYKGVLYHSVCVVESQAWFEGCSLVVGRDCAHAVWPLCQCGMDVLSPILHSTPTMYTRQNHYLYLNVTLCRNAVPGRSEG